MAFVASTPLDPAHAEPVTLTVLVERWGGERASRPALSGPGASESYGELLDRSRRITGGLARLGIGRGDVVAAQLPNGPEFVALYLAAARLGAALQTLHMPYRAAELGELLGGSGARLCVALGRFKEEAPAATLAGLRATLPGLATIVAVGDGVPAEALPWSALVAAEPWAVDAAEPDDPMLLLYTSGTTASPKGVANAHRGFLTNARASAAAFGLGPDDVILPVAPMTHLYGAFALHLALASGAATALLPAFSAAGLAACARETGATAIFAAPAHFTAALGAGLLSPEAFGTVRTICLSGSAVAPELARAVEAALPNARVVQLWGMSELQAGSFGRPDDEAELRHGTAGRPSPGTELRIVGDDGEGLPPGRDGRLHMRGPSLFRGYRGNAAASAAAFTADGWFDTGDTGTLGPEGALRLTGRVKEIINRGGVKFSPVDVELALERLPEIGRAAIVPMPDPALGERAAVFVEPADGARVTLGALTAHLDRLGIAKFKWPERLEIVETMPMTPTGKIMRGRLAALLTEGSR